MREDEYGKVTAFRQHGFFPRGRSGAEVHGDCPFCGHEDHLYINEDTHQWDCKVCGKSGGFKTFLREAYELSQRGITEDRLSVLAKQRGLPVSVLREAHIGWNARVKAFVLPVFGVDGTTLQDLRLYVNGRLISTATCRTGLWNIESIGRTDGVVWLCEGEWDGMALRAIVPATDAVVAVPGAGVFKPMWFGAFQGRHVVALYDNDNAGRRGAEKCYRSLKAIARTLRFLHWSKTRPEGFDIRDLCHELGKADAIRDYITSHLADLPQGLSLVQAKALTAAAAPAVLRNGPRVDAAAVRATYLKWLHLPDPNVIDALYGAVISNRMQGDPVWLFLVAPSGMTKSELLQAYSTCPEVEAVSALTPHALISGATGMGGADPSLIPKLNGRVLVIKDFTVILNMNEQARSEILGILRDAFDGEITHAFGNQKMAHYRSRFGILAGVTPAIEVALEHEGALGERFLRWETLGPKTADAHAQYLLRAMGNVGKEDGMRKELRETAAAVLDYEYPLDKVEISQEIQERVMRMAIVVATLRGVVPRDRYTREVSSLPYTELASRLCKTLLKLLIGITAFRGLNAPTEAEIGLIRRVAHDTAPARPRAVVHAAYTLPDGVDFTLQELSAALGGLPSGFLQRQVESLSLLRVLERSDGGSLRVGWRLTSDVRRLLDASMVFPVSH